MSEQTSRNLPPFMFSHWAYLEPLRKHRAFIVVFGISAVLCALALTYVYSEKYEAAVTLVFSPGEVTRLQFRTSDTQALGAPMPNADFKVIGKTVDDLAISEALLRRVVQEHRLDVSEERNYAGPWYVRYQQMVRDYSEEYILSGWKFLKYGRVPEEDLTANAVRDLASNIKIYNRDSYVFILKVRDKHPLRAAAVADSVARELVREANESTKAGGRTRSLELEALSENKAREIANYQEQINKFTSKNQLASPAMEMDQGLQRLSNLQAEQLRLAAQIRGSEQKIETIKSILKDEANSTRSSARAASERLSSDDLKNLVSDKVTTEVELDSLKARDASLRRSIAELDQRLKQLPYLKLEMDQLNSELARVNREYGIISVALAEMKLGESASVSEWQIQHQATAPTSPVTPIKIYHVSLAAFLGICFSIGLVYLFSYFNVRVFVPSLGIAGRRATTSAEESSGGRRDRSITQGPTEGQDTAAAIQGNETPQAYIMGIPMRSQGGDR